MPDKVEQHIFVSYARRDGAELAQRLQNDLTAVGFDVWLDTQRIGGGASWTVEIEEAIDRANVVLALLTPGSYRSEICRAEQLRSLRKDKCVIPLLAAPGADLPLYLEPKNYRDFTQERLYAGSLESLLGDIQAHDGVGLPKSYRSTPTCYISVPPRVANYIDQPSLVRALRDTIFEADGQRAVALTALEGMGGIGKTVLAQALCKDEVVQQAFPDGIVWITVGREPAQDLTARLLKITAALGGAADGAVDPQTLYRTTIADKAALIVIDDVWSKADLDPLLAESPRSRFLFTTRDASIARFSGAREHRVDLLDPIQSRALLALWAGLDAAQLPPVADEILRQCGDLPLALAVMGALLRGAQTAEWADTAELLDRADLAAIEGQLPPGQESFFRAIDVSVKALDAEMQHHYERLAVLLHGMPARLPVLETLWGVAEAEARRIGRRLADRSLAQRDDEDGLLLHDLQLDYVRARSAQPEALKLIHGAIRLSANVIEKDPRQFASQVAGRLLPFLDAPPIEQFVGEIAAGAPAAWLRLLHPALYASGSALLRTLEGHAAYVSGVAVTPDAKWVVSASGDKTLKVWDLETGRTLRTLEGHSDNVMGVAVTPDGKRAVSASNDRTLKVWDLESGCTLRTLEEHPYDRGAVALTPDGKRSVSACADGGLRVLDLETGQLWRTLKDDPADGVYGIAVTPDGRRAVSGHWGGSVKVWDLESDQSRRLQGGHSDLVFGMAVTPDGKRAVSASGDKTLKLWDLDTGRLLRTLEGHNHFVSAVAVTPDGKRAVSVSYDRTVKVWDLESGHALRSLEGHSAAVFGVALTPDGKWAVSCSGDMTSKVWDLDLTRALLTLEGHSDSVLALALTPDRKRAVSASEDHTLKVWDLETGHVLRTLEGHTNSVDSVAVTPDGKQAVSASLDNTLKVWELDSGRTLRILESGDAVYGVAVTLDGKRAISASFDPPLKVWDLETGQSLGPLRGHSSAVTRVAVTPDGRRAVSGSWDHTLRVWDLETGQTLRVLEGHSDFVIAVAVTPDGKRALSAARDEKTLKVWDVETGRELRTLEGHSATVYGVAVAPDGSRVVSASGDKTLAVWDLDTGRLITTFYCDAPACCCVFVDERTILAGDEGGRVYSLLFEEQTQRNARAAVV